MNEDLGVVLLLLGTGVFLAAITALIWPWKRLLTSRKMAVFALAASTITCGIGGSMLPEPDEAKTSAALDNTDMSDVEAGGGTGASNEEDAEQQIENFKNLWRAMMKHAGSCDRANDRVIAALESGSVYSSYNAADEAHDICRQSWSDLSSLNAPDGLPSDKKKAIDDVLENCADAYLFRQMSLDDLRDALDGGMRPSQVREFEKNAQAAQSGVLACVAGMMARGSDLGIQLEEFDKL